MNSYFDDNGRPAVDLTVIGLDGEVTVSARIDTGHSGGLSLSIPEALSIGLKLRGIVPVLLGDGSIKQEYIFEGEVMMDEENVPVKILLKEGDTLIGTDLLRDKKLTIDYPNKIVLIEKSHKKPA